MSDQSSPMLERLQEFLRSRPDDSFVRYGLGMELAKLGRTDEAAACLEDLIAADPDYVPAYFQAASILARTGRGDRARALLRSGIEAAARKGDSHAAAEMAGLLGEIQ
jgi:tetratricopeptide (TPR) repeat protein